MAALHKVSDEFPDTKEFIDEKLEQKCLRESISIEELIYLSMTSLETKGQHSKLFLLNLFYYYNCIQPGTLKNRLFN